MTAEIYTWDFGFMMVSFQGMSETNCKTKHMLRETHVFREMFKSAQNLYNVELCWSSEPTDLASEISICDPKYVKVSEDDCCRCIYFIL